MAIKKILASLSVAIFVAGCDIGYTRITNNYPGPVHLEIYTTAAKEPSDITLPPGQNIIYRDPSISVRSITVIAPSGDTKTYDSTALEGIAATAHQKMEAIQWSIRPEGISASSP
jgi:hypothetical protein